MRKSIRYLVRYANENYGGHLKIVSSAPGRVDFLNTHQDYKGLPVVPVAIKLRAYMLAVHWDREFHIESLNLKEMGLDYKDTFPTHGIEYEEKGWFGNYFRAVVNTFIKKLGVRFEKGLRVVLYSEVPIGAGLGSSATIEVAFAKLLSYMYNIKLSPKDIAELCYFAEHDELKIPCGRLDQYGSSYGGIIKLETRPPYNVHTLPSKGLLFVIVDSGIKHSTAAIHPVRQSEINKGLEELLNLPDLPQSLREKLSPYYYETKWEDIREEEISPYLERINRKSADRILFTLRMNKLTDLAIGLLTGEISYKVIEDELELSEKVRQMKGWKKRKFIIGEIMNRQHELLRDLYEVSTPELERIRDAMLEAGAYGVKISGAGLGGALIALVDERNSKKVLSAGLDAGAVRGWISGVSPGASVERL